MKQNWRRRFQGNWSEQISIAKVKILQFGMGEGPLEQTSPGWPHQVANQSERRSHLNKQTLAGLSQSLHSDWRNPNLLKQAHTLAGLNYNFQHSTFKSPQWNPRNHSRLQGQLKCAKVKSSNKRWLVDDKAALSIAKFVQQVALLRGPTQRTWSRR